MHHAVKTLTALVLCVAATACYRGPQTKMGNPLVTGQVPVNKLVTTDHWTERGLGIPTDTLSLSASLRSLDSKEICFDIDLSTVAERRHRAGLDGWEAYLEGEPEFVDPRGTITDSLEIEGQLIGGSVLRTDQIQERICTSSGNCYSRVISVSRNEPISVEVLSGGGTLCFANGGHVTSETEHITLHLHDRIPGGVVMGIPLARPPEELKYRWKFVAP